MTEQFRPQETQPSAEQLLSTGAEFLEHFGVNLNPVTQYGSFMETMNQLNPRFQGERGLVRYELEADQTEWPEETKAVILRTAEGMRMLEKETPLKGKFDLVLALGGARQSNLDRTRYAVDAVLTGDAQIGQIVVAGTDRELKGSELESVANYAPGAKTEFDLCAAAAKKVKEENPDLSLKINPQRVIRLSGEERGTPGVIESTLRSFEMGLGAYPRRKEDVLRAARIGVVTTQIYQASSELDLARIARRFGITNIQAAGNPSDPKIVEARTPATYLSEVCRTLRAVATALKEQSIVETLPN